MTINNNTISSGQSNDFQSIKYNNFDDFIQDKVVIKAAREGYSRMEQKHLGATQEGIFYKLDASADKIKAYEEHPNTKKLKELQASGTQINGPGLLKVQTNLIHDTKKIIEQQIQPVGDVLTGIKANTGRDLGLKIHDPAVPDVLTADFFVEKINPAIDPVMKYANNTIAIYRFNKIFDRKLLQMSNTAMFNEMNHPSLSTPVHAQLRPELYFLFSNFKEIHMNIREQDFYKKVQGIDLFDLELIQYMQSKELTRYSQLLTGRQFGAGSTGLLNTVSVNFNDSSSIYNGTGITAVGGLQALSYANLQKLATNIRQFISKRTSIDTSLQAYDLFIPFDWYFPASTQNISSQIGTTPISTTTETYIRYLETAANVRIIPMTSLNYNTTINNRAVSVLLPQQREKVLLECTTFDSTLEYSYLQNMNKSVQAYGYQSTGPVMIDKNAEYYQTIYI